MPDIDIIHFRDRDSDDEAFMLVRVEGTTVGLTLSLRSDGDLEVLFGLAELERLIRALQEAQQRLRIPQPPPHE